MKKLSWSFLILVMGLSASSLYAQNPQKGQKKSTETMATSPAAQSGTMKVDNKTKIAPPALPNGTHAPGVAPFKPESEARLKAKKKAMNRPQQPR